MEKELISDVILAPDGVEYDGKQQKKGETSPKEEIKFSPRAFK